MLISHSHRFIFFHVAKTAGLSVRNALQPYAEEPTKFKIKRPPKRKAGVRVASVDELVDKLKTEAGVL